MAYVHSFVVVLCYLAILSGWTEAQTFSTTLSPSGTVNENEGGLQACVERSGDITDPVTITLTSEDSTAIAPDDYDTVSESLEFTQTSGTIQCINVTIHEDTIIEMTEFFRLLTTSVNTGVTISSPSRFIILQDTSQIQVGFAQPILSLNEASGGNQICTEILVGSVVRDVEIAFDFADGTASGQTDYTAVPSLGMFTAVDNTVCKVATIDDDEIIEEDEFFNASVSGTSSNEVNATGSLQILIIDNDGATLSIDTPTIAVMEGNTSNTIPICIVLDDIMGGLEREIKVTASTVSSTAGDGDFESVSTTLTFFSNSSVTDTMCVEVTVIGDQLYESDETFTVQFRPVNPNDAISGPTMSIITIINDDPIICERLQNPINGNVSFNSTTVGSVAVYTCLPGFDLLPPTDLGFDMDRFIRTCEDDGKWSEEPPTCKGPEVGANTPRTAGIAVGVVVGVAVAIIIIVIIIACLVVRRQHHYNKYVLPNKGHAKPYNIYENREERESTHDDDIARWEAENPPEYVFDQVIGEEPQREPAADEPESLEYQTEAQVQSEEGEQLTSEDHREFAKVDLELEEGKRATSGGAGDFAMMEFGDESIQEDSIGFQDF